MTASVYQHVLLAALLGAQDAPKLKPTVREFLGLNGHTVQYDAKLYAPVARLARDYHPVDWDLGQETDSVPPFPFARNRVSWDHVYGSWKAAGLDVNVSLMFESIPRDKWKDLARDAHAYGKAFARAFGPSAPKPLVASAEIGNEPGKFDDPSYRMLFEAMAKGLREGDPKMRIATCNLIVGKSHEYAKSVDCIKGLEAHYDVLNIHSYAQLEGWPTWRRSFPEDPALKEYLPDIERLIAWRDANAPGKPIWVTEYGWDSTTKRPAEKGTFAKWVGVTDEQQAQYLVRSTLIFMSMAVDRAYVYFFDDKDEPSVHASSGVTRNGKPKPSYHALAHLQRVLGDHRFSRAVQRSADAWVLEFASASDRMLVAWSPSGSGKTATWSPPEGVTVTRAERMPLGADAPTAVEPKAPYSITESPLYLFLGGSGR